MSESNLPPDHTPPPGGGPTGDSRDAFGKVWRRVQKTVEGMPRISRANTQCALS